MSRNKLKFDGGTHARTPMTEEELAQQRERNAHYDMNFLSADEFVEQMGLKWLVNMARGVPAFIKAFVAVSVILGTIAAAKSSGVF